MTVYRSDTGAQLTKSQALATLTTNPAPETTYTATVQLEQSVLGDNEKGLGGGRGLVASVGDVITASQVDALYPSPTITSVTPNTGAAAGGTAVTVKGTKFQSGATLTFGGTTATSIVVVDAQTITAVTPAKTAGAYNVVVGNSSGTTATLTNGFTYS